MNKWSFPLVLLIAPALVMAGGAPTNSGSVPAEVTEGRQIYEQYCAACHGWQGEGAADWNKCRQYC
ncbi:c-type cytochrome [Marinobacter sp.]|uniref:c-type cytochrome n=1 Tax=Marinobacter sp. TaxID=50741 RepID=UPI0035C6BCA5